MVCEKICVSKELETTRNADEKHVNISDTYFHVYNKGMAVYRKENMGDLDINIIKVHYIVFIISHDKFTQRMQASKSVYPVTFHEKAYNVAA